MTSVFFGVLLASFLVSSVVFGSNSKATRPEVPFAIPSDLLTLEVYIPKDSPLTTHRIALGELLFSDRRLSRDKTRACVDCHRPESSFTAPIITARNRNPPVIFNRLFSRRQFWDSRADHLEEQIKLTIRETSEMNFSGTEAVKRLNADSDLKAEIQNAFGRKTLQEADLYRALASFVRSIVSFDSKFDQVSRKESGIQFSELEEKGRVLFFEKFKCAVCHSGTGFTNERLSPPCYPQFGQTAASPSGVKRKFHQMFKTPTLRGLSKSGPYFHNGGLSTLEETIEFYDRSGPPPLDFIDAELFQVPIAEISRLEITQLKAFLETLNGTIEYGFPRKKVLKDANSL